MNENQFLSKTKVSMVWLAITLGCIAVTNIYAVFGHGIRSDSMDFMFLYPLGGALVYFLCDMLSAKTGRDGYGRLGANLFNSGLATLTAGGMLKGVLEIAGTGSGYAAVFDVAGWGLAGLGGGIMIWIVGARR